MVRINEVNYCFTVNININHEIYIAQLAIAQVNEIKLC